MPASVAFAKHSLCANAVANCAAALGEGPVCLLLAFAGGRHPPDEALGLLRARFPGVPVVGGSVAGVISRSGLGYTGEEFGLVAFRDPRTAPRVVWEGGMLEGEEACGEALGARVRALAAPGAVVLGFFDSVAQGSPLKLHPASLLVRGFNRAVEGMDLCFVGGGMLSDLDLSDAWVFDGEAARKHAAVALVFPPAVRAHAAVMHGCLPVSGFMEVTRIEGAEVFELDDRPALEAIEEALGMAPGSAGPRDLTLRATLGERQGSRFAPYSEGAYVNRLIVAADPGAGSVTLFEPDFGPFTQVQIMSRDNALMIDSVVRGVEAANAAARGARPLLALYVDCAGRSCARSGAAVEEAEVAARGIDPELPFLGFYSGVEIAPLAGQASKPLDWTGVLAVLVEDA